MLKPPGFTFRSRGWIWSRNIDRRKASSPSSIASAPAWEKTKARVKKAMQDMADELLKLYAQRKSAQGHAFPADTQWKKEFEDAFEFNETDDQAHGHRRHQARYGIQLPMDRLLCGDVGYGKTEVSMRAAFKAVRTTNKSSSSRPPPFSSSSILKISSAALPHFPSRIEMMSRFRTPKQQKETASESSRQSGYRDRHASPAFKRY